MNTLPAPTITITLALIYALGENTAQKWSGHTCDRA